MSVKRALKEAVDNKSEYFAWINGEQTSARYNLATHLDETNWKSLGDKKVINLFPKNEKRLDIVIDNSGKIIDGNTKTSWQGKKLDEVIGKGLADKIMSSEKGTLAGEGLKFGGEWADNLYDRQVGNIVKDLTGAKIEVLDMGLPIEVKNSSDIFYTNIGLGESYKISNTSTLKPGQTIYSPSNQYNTNSYIITDVLGDGKFKAVPKDRIITKNVDRVGLSDMIKTDTSNGRIAYPIQYLETFNISNKTTTQQGIKLTPEIIAKIKGEALEIKTSGNKFEFPKANKKATVKLPKK
jgi:hypothetical protein